VKLILTHSNADFDGIAAMLAVHKLHPDTLPVLPDHVNRNVQHFITLYRNGVNFVSQRDLPSRKIAQIYLVDTQHTPNLRGIRPGTPLVIYDHHQPFERDDLPPHQELHCEPVGAVTTLLVERIQQAGLHLSGLEATLLMLGIYEDTGTLTYGTTTVRDIRAAAWLMDQNAALDTVRRFLTPRLNEEQERLFDTLLVQTDTRSIQGHTVSVSATRVDSYIHEVSTVAHRLRDTLEPDALFVAVEMPESLLLVCRSAGQGIDAATIAAHFGGGGHARAAAATIYDRPLPQLLDELWHTIQQQAHPAARVADLMSYGVQTVESDKPVSAIVRQMRRIGHEGFPVVEDGRVIGLLTRREVDRATEHGLGELKLRDIMTTGSITVRPDDPVAVLEKRMVESGWGQIPVVDDQEHIIGIVTRTDLIKHWTHTHPDTEPERASFSQQQIIAVMGTAIAELIAAIGHEAQQKGLHLYMVGGVVRDLLLQRPNLDIDFVVESSAIDFAAALQGRFGGETHSFEPFGTAKWLLETQVAARLGADVEALPHHIDFATARNEFYEHPTALPTVYRGSIKLDLQRRDFTINTLAIQLSPPAAEGRILDFYGGLNDLRDGLIRVLHSLSFVDDPTRILRAIRFERRLNFSIEPRTMQLIATALPMLRRITGKRITNEIDLLLRENQPEYALLNLHERGVLEAIHPAFTLDNRVMHYFAAARQQTPPWTSEAPDIVHLYWHILAGFIAPEHLEEWCERLMLGRRQIDSMRALVAIRHEMERLQQSDLAPSQIVTHLEEHSETALHTLWLTSEDAWLKGVIEKYLCDWRFVQPGINGHHLRDMGLKPGPCYSVILRRLRYAWLDGLIKDSESENRLLAELVTQESSCRDSA
jgi:tRNA nucleotidyltransferase (CCA-adding enzyme)